MARRQVREVAAAGAQIDEADPRVWSRLVADQLASGLGQDRFCRERQVHPGRFHYWKYTKLARMGLEPGKLQDVRPAAPADLVPVRVVEDGPSRMWEPAPGESRSSGVEVLLPGGLRISLERGFDASVLREAVEVLRC